MNNLKFYFTTGCSIELSVDDDNYSIIQKAYLNREVIQHKTPNGVMFIDTKLAYLLNIETK